MIIINSPSVLIKKLSTSDQSVKLISTSYFLLNNEDTKFNIWKKRFHFIHGRMESQKKPDLQKLNDRYQVDLNSNDDVFKLIYILESFYSTLLILFLTKIISSKTEFNTQFLRVIDNSFPKQVNRKYLTSILVFEENWMALEMLYNEIIINIDFDGERDLVRELFEDLFDKRIRHSLGEFFTPDWLSQVVIKNTVKDGFIGGKSFLDPTCGSGTFIRNIVRMYKEETHGQIFHNVYGIDINPVSVFAAQINYLIEYFDYFRNFDRLPEELPIYEADVTQEVKYTLDLFDAKTEYITDRIGKVDFVVGNPPWVNWEYLPKDYKERTYEAWRYYGLYDGKGLDSNFLKEDISCLITYIVANKYLKLNGRLGFLLKESLLKSVKQGKQFRKLFLKPEGIHLGVDRIIDLTNLSPFDGINPRTIGLFFSKGVKTKFPISYIILKSKDKKKRFDVNSSLFQIQNLVEFEEIQGSPSDPKDLSSALMTLDKNLMSSSQAVMGKSEYKARTGVFTGGGNGLFWLKILERKDKILLVENLTERAKNKVEKVNLEIESRFIFPFVTGSDLGFWTYEYQKYIVCPHTTETRMNPIDYTELSKYPLMQNYFDYFKNNLMIRKGFTGLDKNIHKKYYYSLQRIGEYTFEPYKVAWKYISKSFTPVVIEDVNDNFLGNKTCLPSEKVVYVGLSSAIEAYYLCGLLSSSLIRQTIESFMVGTQITPSIISNIRIDKFDDKNNIHIRISNLCRKGHLGEIEIEVAIKVIDELLVKLYKL
ncbi:N-6 DNA methylase [Peijinzhouia sedimentorum]